MSEQPQEGAQPQQRETPKVLNLDIGTHLQDVQLLREFATASEGRPHDLKQAIGWAIGETATRIRALESGELDDEAGGYREILEELVEILGAPSIESLPDFLRGFLRGIRQGLEERGS